VLLFSRTNLKSRTLPWTDEKKIIFKARVLGSRRTERDVFEIKKHYNLERARMALNGETPAARLKTKMSTEQVKVFVANKTD